MSLVPQHRGEEARIQDIAGDGDDGEGDEEDDVEDEESGADPTEGRMRRFPWQIEQQGVDDPSTL